ncbi:subunit 17 of mediator complex-domain-containing protein, partial [Hypoxylon crocopeplum]
MTSPFSLRPWPIGDKKPKNLGEFIARINIERGGFRNVTEAQLREEIAAQENGHAEVEGSSDSEDEEEEADTDKSKNVMVARDEFLRNIEIAHQNAMMCLDLVSLLITKETEKQHLGEMTLSTALRERVGISTLGVSKVKDSNLTEARRQDDLAIATGWRLRDIDNAVDSVVAAAERLEKEMDLEAKYWADVLAVSDDGWTICAVPGEPHTFGVRFGSAESAPEFRDNSIAPFRRKDDGSVHLDVGHVGGGAQRVRVTLKRKGRIVDQSPLPGRTRDDAPIQNRVLEARNTAFHQELWYEINREARTLLSSDVGSDSSCITWKQDGETDVIFTLEDLGEPDSANESISINRCSCTAYYLYMQFLLFHGHRQNYYKRTTTTQLPPSRVAMNQPYAILRAIIANCEYYRDCQVLADFLDDLVYTLKRAGISTASCKSTSQPLAPTLQGNPTRRNAKSELNFINSLAARIESSFELNITPEARIFVHGVIKIVPYIGMHFRISLAPFSSNNDNDTSNGGEPTAEESADQKPPNPLEILYPPSEDSYPNVKEVIYYIRRATVRAVTEKLADDTAVKLGRKDVDWADMMSGPVIVDRNDREAQVDIVPDVNGQLVLSLDASWHSGKDLRSHRIDSHRWAWRADCNLAAGEHIADAVLKLMSGQCDDDG